MKQKDKTTIKYGTVTLPVYDSVDPLVPVGATDVNIKPAYKKALAYSLRDNMPMLIMGHTGTGKTSAIRYIASLVKLPYVRVNMTGYTTPDELIGSKSVKDGHTYYEDGIITNAMKRGAILVLDEINATSPDCLFILHGLLDDDRRITLPNGDVIQPHENFRVFATCNPDYEGTHSMNRAFLDRFPFILTFDTLSPNDEVELLQKRTGIPQDMANILVSIATMNRTAFTEQKTLTYLSTRTLLTCAAFIQAGMSIQEAVTYSLINKGRSDEDKQVIRDYCSAVLKSNITDKNEVPYVTTKSYIDSLIKRYDEVVKEKEEWATKKIQLENLLEQHKQVLRSTEIERNIAQTKCRELEQKVNGFEALKQLIEKIQK